MKLKDSNWSSERQSIMQKYDKNGDGKFDVDEVEGIIDDFMATMYSQQSLAHSNQLQKKVIIFGAIMFVLLTLSNLGVGIAVANLSKDIKVVDGKMMGIDGDGTNSALMTAQSVKMFSGAGIQNVNRRRGLNEDDDEDSIKTIACISPKAAKEIFDAVATSGSANIVLDNEVDFSTFVLPIGGDATKMLKTNSLNRRLADEKMADDAPTDDEFSYIFRNAGVMFVADDPMCQPQGSKGRHLQNWSFGSTGMAMFAGAPNPIFG